MDNLKIYNAVAEVPSTAKKEIKGGRLNGKTDINPMWRIKSLTEQFGPCGIGWYPEILSKRLEEGAGGEIAAFVDIALYIKVENEWSKPIAGTGGSMFVAKEKNGMYTNDEAYKMAYTDAISVACKSLGMGASVYWDKDKTKYEKTVNLDRDDAPTEKQIEAFLELGGSIRGLVTYLDKDVDELTREDLDKAISLKRKKKEKVETFQQELSDGE